MKRYISSALLLLGFSLHAVESKLELRQRESKGVGYNQGYSTADYLLSQSWGAAEILLNLRAHVFNNARLAGNGGFGFRWMLGEEKMMVGVNAFYDIRETSQVFSQQMGAGLEFLSKKLDVRGNGYLPICKKSDFEQRSFTQFSGNSIIIKQTVHAALPSAEIEVGSPVTSRLYLALAPYYLFNKEVRGLYLGKSWGGRFRAEVKVDRVISLGALVTHDAIFETTWQGYVALNIPLGPRGEKSKEKKRRNLRAVPIMRNEIIPFEKKQRLTPLYTGDDETSTVGVVFVNNTFSGPSLGSFEAPFPSLKEAEAHSHPGDVIYVFPGDGTARNMDEGIVLKENQTLVSSAAPLTIGGIEIPAMTPGLAPVITNIHPDEPVVTNPGSTHLENFHVIEPKEYFQEIEPWEYFFGRIEAFDGSSAISYDNAFDSSNTSSGDPDPSDASSSTADGDFSYDPDSLDSFIGTSGSWNQPEG